MRQEVTNTGAEKGESEKGKNEGRKRKRKKVKYIVELMGLKRG